MKSRLVLLLLFACGAVRAQTDAGLVAANLTWTPPTKDVAGATLQPGDLTGYAVYIGTQSRFASGTTPRAGCTTTPAAATDTGCYASTRQAPLGSSFSFTHTLTFTAPTQTAYYAMASLGKNGGIGPYSNEASKAYTFTSTAPINPAAPVTVTVTVTVTCNPQPCTVTVAP